MMYKSLVKYIEENYNHIGYFDGELEVFGSYCTLSLYPNHIELSMDRDPKVIYMYPDDSCWTFDKHNCSFEKIELDNHIIDKVLNQKIKEGGMKNRYRSTRYPIDTDKALDELNRLVKESDNKKIKDNSYMIKIRDIGYIEVFPRHCKILNLNYSAFVYPEIVIVLSHSEFYKYCPLNEEWIVKEIRSLRSRMWQ